MGSSPLYLAIVVVWILVLVPMLLRRDAADPTAGGLRRDSARDDASDTDLDDEHEADEYDTDSDDSDDFEDTASDAAKTQVLTYRPDPSPAPREAERATEPDETGVDAAAETVDGPVAAPFAEPVRRVSRARIIARRRRRTSGLSLLVVATGVAVGMELGPWWVLAPPVVLLLGHLTLLREAAKVDREQRAAERERRRRDRIRARRAAAEAAREAEIIQLASRRNQVYDQYADAQLRAAGD